MKPFIPGLLIHKDPARQRVRFNASPTDAPITTPEHLDRKREMLPSSDQADTSQCAAYAMAGCIEWWRWKQLGILEQIDPNPIYARAKEIDGYPDVQGTTLEAVVRAAVDLLLIPINLDSLRQVYQNDFERALHQHGVVLAGFDITASWGKTQPDGWIPDEPGVAIGGHAVVLTGYSRVDQPNWIGMQNSWGDTEFGWRGFCRMKYDQFRNEFCYGLVWDIV